MKQIYFTPAFKTIAIGIRSGVCNDPSYGIESLRSGAYGNSTGSETFTDD